MLFRRPCYYDNFTCIADKCTDNCCIGWEICIDSEAAEFYKSVEGALGKRLNENICHGDEPSFILKGERCPFLNKGNLCDIITELGEGALCQICRDHPRYFEWYGNEKEGGIGLSCQEAARLILSEENFADYFEGEVDDYPDEDFDKAAYDFLLRVRDGIFDILCDTELDFCQKADAVLSLCHTAQQQLGNADRAELFPFSLEKELSRAIGILEKTEPIDEKWTAEFEGLRSTPLALSPDDEDEKYMTRLFAYFVWRYFLTGVFDYDIVSKVRFALFGVTVVYALYCLNLKKDFNTLRDAAVLFSKQMEYSEENLDTFFCNID